MFNNPDLQRNIAISVSVLVIAIAIALIVIFFFTGDTSQAPTTAP